MTVGQALGLGLVIFGLLWVHPMIMILGALLIIAGTLAKP